MHFLHEWCVSYKKIMMPTAKVFGLSYCGFLIFGARGQNTSYLWCITWERTREPAVTMVMIYSLTEVVVTHVYTQVELHPSVHVRFVNFITRKSYLKNN